MRNEIKNNGNSSEELYGSGKCGNSISCSGSFDPEAFDSFRVTDFPDPKENGQMFADAKFHSDGCKRPYKCPICEGKGSVLRGFYKVYAVHHDGRSEPCKSCNSTGIVWG